MSSTKETVDGILGLVMLGGIAYGGWLYMTAGPSEEEVIKALPQDARLERVITSELNGYFQNNVPTIKRDGNTISITAKCRNNDSGTCGFSMVDDFNKLVVFAAEVGAPLTGKKFIVSYTTRLMDKYGNDAGESPVLTAEWDGNELAKVKQPSRDMTYVIAGLADRVEFGRFGADEYKFLCKDAKEGPMLRFCLKALTAKPY